MCCELGVVKGGEACMVLDIYEPEFWIRNAFGLKINKLILCRRYISIEK
jgi:hypothetical protein